MQASLSHKNWTGMGILKRNWIDSNRKNYFQRRQAYSKLSKDKTWEDVQYLVHPSSSLPSPQSSSWSHLYHKFHCQWHCEYHLNNSNSFILIHWLNYWLNCTHLTHKYCTKLDWFFCKWILSHSITYKLCIQAKHFSAKIILVISVVTCIWWGYTFRWRTQIVSGDGNLHLNLHLSWKDVKYIWLDTILTFWSY